MRFTSVTKTDDLMIGCFFLGFKPKQQTMWCHHRSLSISAILAASIHWSCSLYLEAILRSLRFAHLTVGATTSSSTPIPWWQAGHIWPKRKSLNFSDFVFTLLDFRPTMLVMYVMAFYGSLCFFWWLSQLLSSLVFINTLTHYPMDWLVPSILPLWPSHYCRCWNR